MTRYFAKHVFDGTDWRQDVAVTVDAQGMISGMEGHTAARPGDVVLNGYVLPAMPNVHSHAFQRAMAGEAEKITEAGKDSFWTWRKLMYAFVDRMEPEDVRAVAAWLYAEMLKAGYGWVGEFHYLHHDTHGRHYDMLWAMSEAHVEAAKESGIGMTLIPSLYVHSNFGERPYEHGQRRFINSHDSFVRIMDWAVKHRSARMRPALSFHSLRAVTMEHIKSIRPLYPDLNVHMHLSEQVKEVEDSVAFSGMRPGEYLFDNIDVDGKWTLIHSTHLNDAERTAIAKSGAVVGLCPTTEANLGDGVFQLAPYVAEDGRLAIGTDSHISIDPVEELRTIEYVQRLFHRGRSLTASNDCPSPAMAMMRAMLSGGAQSMDAPIGAIAAGKSADFIVVDADAPCFAGGGVGDMLDRYVFGRQGRCVREVVAGGKIVVKDGRHVREEELYRDFRKVMEKIYAAA